MTKQWMICAAGVAMCLTGCATAPETRAEQRSLEERASATLDTMKARDARLDEILDGAAGYVVFPEIGKGGALVGGAYGRGVVFEGGKPVGYAELSQASIGAQLGGQTFAELIVFQDAKALTRLKTDNFDIGGNISAVALTSGGGAAAQFEGGVAVFVMPRGGLMVDLSVNGQKIDYQPQG
ncbi:MAG TPA: lipid-binding SYLF domain-containing protein [Kofleriaceae bacterium]|nr:lipid-binding SYLF domain-containing protein [Kofleriaceae bacterium]